MKINKEWDKYQWVLVKLLYMWPIKIDHVSSEVLASKGLFLEKTSFKWTHLHETTINRGTPSLIWDQFSKCQSFAKISPWIFKEQTGCKPKDLKNFNTQAFEYEENAKNEELLNKPKPRSSSTSWLSIH